MQCGKPDFPLYGMTGLSVVLSMKTSIESVAHYSCNNGYTLILESKRVCQSNGTWSGMPPYCVGMFM